MELIVRKGEQEHEVRLDRRDGDTAVWRRWRQQHPADLGS